MEDNERAEKAFKRLVTVNSKAYKEKLQMALQAQATAKEINEARRAEAKDESEEKDNKEDEEPQLMGEANSAMNDLMTSNANNADGQVQLVVYRRKSDYVKCQSETYILKCEESPYPPKTTQSWCMQLWPQTTSYVC